jgi:hypothetical protein
MPLLPNDHFLAQLKALFDAQQARPAGKGSIYVTQKSAAAARGAGGRPACLYRATDGRLKKFSTHVTAEESLQFHARCMNILKVRGREGGDLRRLLLAWDLFFFYPWALTPRFTHTHTHTLLHATTTRSRP